MVSTAPSSVVSTATISRGLGVMWSRSSSASTVSLRALAVTVSPSWVTVTVWPAVSFMS